MSNRSFPRLRTPLPQGYVLGRASSGVGVGEAVHIADLATAVLKTGIVSGAGGGPNSGQLWQAGAVTVLGTIAGGATLTITNGVLTVVTPAQEWNAGTVTALGTVAGGATLGITSGTLGATIPAQEWNAGSVATLGTVAGGATLGISGGALDITGGWAGGGVTALGTVAGGLTLAISSGTLSASGTASGGGGSSGNFFIQTVGSLSNNTDAGAFASKGNLMTPHDTIVVNQLFANMFGNGTSGALLTAYICNVGTSLTVGTTLAQSNTVTYGALTTGRMLTFDFSPSVTLQPLTEYAFIVTLTNGTNTTALELCNNNGVLSIAAPGFYNKSTDASGFGIHFAGTTIAAGNTLVSNSTTLFNIGVGYSAFL